MKAFLKSSKRKKWTGGLELVGMLLILISFYYQAFYEGDSLKHRYDNIRFKLELIQNEVIHSSELYSQQPKYNLGNIASGFNEDRKKVNDLSEEHISTIDEINSLVSSIRAWIFIAGSLMLIVSKYFQFYWQSDRNRGNDR